MQLGVRSRILLWLGATALPIMAIGFFSAYVVEARLTERVESELSNNLRLESDRIDRQLDALVRDVEELAHRAGVSYAIETIETDPSTAADLDAVATDLVEAATGTSHVARAVTILDIDGEVLGTTADAPRPAGASNVLAGTTIGPAHRAGPGDDRVPVATAIRADDGSLLGSLVIEFDLAPITDLLRAHEGFGQSSEAHLAQPTDGGAEYISELRFDREAAFDRIVPRTSDAAIIDALDADAPTVVHALDYRGEPSVIAYQRIEATGWALVVEIDQAEALGAGRSLRSMLIAGLLLMALAIAGGWALVLRPLVQRIRRAAAAAEKIADGHYEEPIGDTGSDEIGEMARSIDRLAADLSRDISKRTAAEAKLLHQATHDQLTGVSNRLYAERVLRSQLEEVDGGRVSLLFLDLDGFKEINDTWGHSVGDEILVEVAQRLDHSVPREAMVARWGGDEFVVLLADCSPHQLARTTAAVRDVFEQPFRTTVGAHPLGASIGAATSGHGTSVDELIHLADGRMFREKEGNRRSRVLSGETARMVEAALAEDRVEAWLQPIVSLEDGGGGRCVGAEALARLRNPDGTVIEPSDFMPELRNSRFAHLLDLRIAEMTLAELARWRRAGTVDETFLVALNLSTPSLMHPNLTGDLMDAVRRHDVPPTQIVIELSQEVAEPNHALITTLRGEGFRFAVDDLGQKHSNLDRLFSTGATLAKVDRRWSSDDDVLAGLVRTCSAKGVELIVQGVETSDEAAAVLAHGIRCVQGFHFGRPVPPGALAVALNS